jgi:hypothetical protein
MRHRCVYLAGALVLSTVSAMGQLWINPGTTTSPSSCAPFHDQSAGTTEYYCYYGGSFPWFAAGGGWTTTLRIAAPASGTIQVKYDFTDKLDYLQYGDTSPTDSSEALFELSPNQPSEVTLLGLSNEGPPYATASTGTVHVEVRCADKATCAAVVPQLIYSALPGTPWYLSGTMSMDISVPTQPDSTVWSAVGVNDPQASTSTKLNQIMSFVILNDSGIDQQYTVSAYNQSGALIGSKVVSVGNGVSKGYVLDTSVIPNLPAGLVKLRVAGNVTDTSGVDGPTCQLTVLQFKGMAATALLPVAEQFPVTF